MDSTSSNATSVGVARMRPSASVVPERDLIMMPILRIFPSVRPLTLNCTRIVSYPCLNKFVRSLKGAVSRYSAKLDNYKVPVKLRET